MERGSHQVDGDQVREESSWRYPLIIFLVTLILCVIFLYHYVGPDVDELQGNRPRPTINDEVVSLSVAGVTFDVPANHTLFPRDRRSGERESVVLYASWPRMDGYVPARREDFVENSRDARRIDMTIFQKKTPYTETDRFDILYLPRVTDPKGTPSEHGLQRFTFRQGQSLGNTPSLGYSSRDMFVGEDNAGRTAVLFCYKDTGSDVVAPECYREFDFDPAISVKYRFKKPFLAEWRQIDEKVRLFVEELADQDANG